MNMTFLNAIGRLSTAAYQRLETFASIEEGGSSGVSDGFLFGAVVGGSVMAAGCGGNSVAVGFAAGLLATAGGAAAWLSRRRSPSSQFQDEIVRRIDARAGVRPKSENVFFNQLQIKGQEDSCQTTAFLNGALAWDPGVRTTYGPDLANTIRKIRDHARTLESEGDLSVTAVFNAMMRLGYPLHCLEWAKVPVVRLTEKLFGENRFAVFRFAGESHAYTYLPIAGAAKSQFVLRVD